MVWVLDSVLLLYLCYGLCVLFFFFKHKTEYDMRISDWSSDVCSSDLHGDAPERPRGDLRALAGGEEGREALCGEARVFLGSQERIDSRRKERPPCPVKPTSTAATFRTARPPCTSRTAATSSPTESTKWCRCSTASWWTRTCTSTASTARWASCALPRRCRARR